MIVAGVERKVLRIEIPSYALQGYTPYKGIRAKGAKYECRNRGGCNLVYVRKRVSCRDVFAFVLRVTKAVTFTTSKTVIKTREKVSVFKIYILKIIATINKKTAESVVLKVIPPKVFRSPLCAVITAIATYVIFTIVC